MRSWGWPGHRILRAARRRWVREPGDARPGLCHGRRPHARRLNLREVFRRETTAHRCRDGAAGRTSARCHCCTHQGHRPRRLPPAALNLPASQLAGVLPAPQRPLLMDRTHIRRPVQVGAVAVIVAGDVIGAQGIMFDVAPAYLFLREGEDIGAAEAPAPLEL
ncbi:MAG: hypothetical protein MZV64_71375 [Ignavibacteriales bacterium]|nr:hypothetical protein [Ignavibacteriales bacterium]